MLLQQHQIQTLTIIHRELGCALSNVVVTAVVVIDVVVMTVAVMTVVVMTVVVMTDDVNFI